MVFAAGQHLTASALNALVLTDTWNDMTLLNSWVVGVQPQYRIDPDGMVHLRGRVANGTNTVGTVIATLPAGYRSTISQRFVCGTGSTGTTYGCIQVEGDGDLVIAAAAGIASYNFDNIQYGTT